MLNITDSAVCDGPETVLVKWHGRPEQTGNAAYRDKDFYSKSIQSDQLSISRSIGDRDRDDIWHVCCIVHHANAKRHLAVWVVGGIDVVPTYLSETSIPSNADAHD